MAMLYNAEKGTYEFGYDYIGEYVKKHTKSNWNETQLYVIVETLVNAIDTITEEFLCHDHHYIGTAIWLFEQLWQINNYVRPNHLTWNKDDVNLKNLEKPLLQFRRTCLKAKYQESWILNIELDGHITRLHQLSFGMFDNFKLAKLQQSYRINAEQDKDGHAIINEILTEAINTLKNSDIYKKAEAENCLYYDLLANLPEEEREEITPLFPLNKKSITETKENTTEEEYSVPCKYLIFMDTLRKLAQEKPLTEQKSASLASTSDSSILTKRKLTDGKKPAAKAVRI